MWVPIQGSSSWSAHTPNTKRGREGNKHTWETSTNCKEMEIKVYEGGEDEWKSVSVERPTNPRMGQNHFQGSSSQSDHTPTRKRREKGTNAHHGHQMVRTEEKLKRLGKKTPVNFLFSKDSSNSFLIYQSHPPDQLEVTQMRSCSSSNYRKLTVKKSCSWWQLLDTTY